MSWHPFCQRTSKRKVAQAAFSFCTFHSSLFTLHFSLKFPRDFSREEIREKREKKMYLFAVAKSIFVLKKTTKCDRMESESSTANREHGGKDISQGSTVDSGSLTNKVAGFDSATLVDHDESISSASGTDRTELTHGETIDDTASRTSRIHGNIGVTTSQQMLESELDIAPRLNFYRFIAEEFKKRFCILVY